MGDMWEIVVDVVVEAIVLIATSASPRLFVHSHYPDLAVDDFNACTPKY